MSVPPVIQYPLDLTGTSPTNHIVGETRDIVNNNERIFVPNAGPFYTEDFRLYNAETGQPLTPVDDYVLAQPFAQASMRTGKDVQCAVVIKVNAPIRLAYDYRVVGGEYSWNLQGLIDLISELDLDDRPIKWGSIIGRPTAYPPAPHIHDIGDTFGWEYVVWQLERITNAIMIGDEASHDELRSQFSAMLAPVIADLEQLDLDVDRHVNDTTNPHQVTKAQVGLGSVQNYGIASSAEALAGTATNRYMTPALVRTLAQDIATTTLNPHLTDRSNPHAVTKAQVGLGSVENYGVSTQAEAEAGTSNVKYMTPLRVKQAIMITAGNLLNSHVADKANPHNVTKAQVGLGSVENFALATQPEAVAGVVNNKYMTPLRTKDAIDQMVGNTLNAHVTNLNNPHAVTKAQVGLGSVDNFATATQAEAQAGAVSNKFMTPLRTKQAIDELAGNLVNAHIANKNNPHEVTKSQVGLGSVQNYGIATQGEAEAGSNNAKYMTPLRTKQAIDTQVANAYNAHAANRSNPHAVTKAQVGLGNVDNFATASAAEASAGTAANRFMTPAGTTSLIDRLAGSLVNSHIADKGNPHGVTKAQVGLSNVENYVVSSKAEAEAGTANNRYMTPLRTKEAIDVFAGNLVNSHIADKSNPHAVTKAQVGLGSVQDYPVASTAEATAGTATNRYMTPALVTTLASRLASETLATHASNTNNPHSVTKSQVGLGNVDNFATATQAQAQAGTLNDRFMTPLRTKQAIDVFAGDLVNAHVSNRSNPHAVTKAQVGLGSVLDYGIATQAEAQAGTSNVKYMTPLRTKEAITSQAVTPMNTHISARNNPHAVTAAQVGAYTQAQVNNLLNGKLDTTGTAANSALLGGNSKEELATWIYAMSGTMARRNLHVSTVAPSNTQGDIGDVWFQY